ncbi:cilia- and flagella-associated protein 36 [Prorops nasuta]|uniref:cilia- and flagella-associated protein 36 n=1 Tax=Prorops nasuta TaxID=863751 RepID=UPI0034CDCEC4
MTNKKEDSGWVFDSLVGFLQGPIWSAPLLTFIEEKSLIFEADIEDDPEYWKTYQEYKNLVDLLLGCFMEDMGISSELFEHACSVNKTARMPVQFQQNLFEQIWAANEYKIFKRMMIQKNLELQLQALNMIEQKYGLTPASLVYDSDEKNDELVMEELINKRILEEASLEKEEVDISEEAFLEERERIATEYRNEKALLEEALRTSSPASPATSSSDHQPKSSSVEPVERPPETSGEKPDLLQFRPIEAAGKNILEDQTEKKEDIKKEDMKKRQDYLRERRDKLVALKKEVRSQRLKNNDSTRPSSARLLAEATVKGNLDLDDVPEKVESSIIQIRKALAARLKAEVVNK